MEKTESSIESIGKKIFVKNPACPNCGRIISWFQKPEKCAFTKQLICSQCIVHEKFSDKVADQIPEEFHQKYRVYNWLQYIIASVLIYGFIATSWPSFVGWKAYAPFEVISSALITIARLILALVIGLTLLRMAHIGTWMFYRWIERPQNRALIERAKEAYVKGEYKSENRWYNQKIALIQKLQQVKWHLFYYTLIGVNMVMIILFLVIRYSYSLAGSVFSMIAGILFVISSLGTLGMIWMASAFYCRKSIDNTKNRKILELLSWIYVLLIPIVYVPFILANVIRYELMDGTLAFANFLEYLHITMYIIQMIVGSLIALKLSKLTAFYNWKENEKEAPQISNLKTARMYSILKGLVILVLFMVFIIIYILALELITTDFAMVFCVISYYLIGVYFVVMFALWKLMSKKPIPLIQRRHNYGTMVKMSLIIIIINFSPLIGTVFWTNPSLDQQFDDTFGADWKSHIPKEELARMHQVKFTWFDAYMGYIVPGNAQYENVYMESHPRFVKDRSTGAILSNGSQIFTNITHKMIFDAYLPATPEFNITFGDGKPKKFPILIYMHGVGMDRGSGNANTTSQYFANLGYAVFDMSYGFTGMASYPYTGGKESGYDFVDTIHHIGVFTKYLENHSDYYHADLSNTFFAGRSFGGWMALVCGFAQASPLGGNFSSKMQVKGVIPFYPASDIPSVGSELWGLGQDVGVLSEGEYYIRNSSNPKDPDFNPEWYWFDPLWLGQNTPKGGLPAVYAVQGTHDYLVPQGAVKRLEAFLRPNGHKIIAGYYPFGSHGFDALHWSPYGQSVLYYQARFMAVTQYIS